MLLGGLSAQVLSVLSVVCVRMDSLSMLEALDGRPARARLERDVLESES